MDHYHDQLAHHVLWSRKHYTYSKTQKSARTSCQCTTSDMCDVPAETTVRHYHYIILKRIQNKLDEYTGATQCAYKRGRSCGDIVWSVRMMLSEH